MIGKAVGLASACMLLSMGGPALAHHGRDFLFSQTAETPHPGDTYVVPRQDFIVGDDADEFEFEPAFLIGATQRLAFEVHGHAAREQGQSFEHESTAAALHFRITPAAARLGVGVSGEYEFSHVAQTEDRAELRIAVSRNVKDYLLALNVAAERELHQGDGVEWGYSAGVRRTLARHVAAGLEAQGSLEHAEHEALAGLYLDLSDRVTVNVGVGTGLGHSDIERSFRTAVVWRIGHVGQ